MEGGVKRNFVRWEGLGKGSILPKVKDFCNPNRNFSDANLCRGSTGFTYSVSLCVAK